MMIPNLILKAKRAPHRFVLEIPEIFYGRAKHKETLPLINSKTVTLCSKFHLGG